VNTDGGPNADSSDAPLDDEVLGLVVDRRPGRLPRPRIGEGRESDNAGPVRVDDIDVSCESIEVP